MDMPLFLNPLSMVKGKPVLFHDGTEKARFGIFLRYYAERVQCDGDMR